MKKTWDSKCEELAHYFLSGYTVSPATLRRLREELATEIQCSIEDWLDNYGEDLPALRKSTEK